MKEQAIKTEMAAPDLSETSGASASASANTPGTRIKTEPEGAEGNPIELCQYPTTRHEHVPTVQVSMPPAPPTVVAPTVIAPAFQPANQYYFSQFPANYDRLGTTGREEDSLFVPQSPTPWVDGGVPQNYGYHHEAGTGHGAF